MTESNEGKKEFIEEVPPQGHELIAENIIKSPEEIEVDRRRLEDMRESASKEDKNNLEKARTELDLPNENELSKEQVRRIERGQILINRRLRRENFEDELKELYQAGRSYYEKVLGGAETVDGITVGPFRKTQVQELRAKEEQMEKEFENELREFDTHNPK